MHTRYQTALIEADHDRPATKTVRAAALSRRHLGRLGQCRSHHGVITIFSVSTSRRIVQILNNGLHRATGLVESRGQHVGQPGQVDEARSLSADRIYSVPATGPEISRHSNSCAEIRPLPTKKSPNQ